MMKTYKTSFKKGDALFKKRKFNYVVCLQGLKALIIEC